MKLLKKSDIFKKGVYNETKTDINNFSFVNVYAGM